MDLFLGGSQCNAGVNEGVEGGGAEVVKCGGEALVEDDEAEVVVAFVGAGLDSSCGRGAISTGGDAF